MGHSSPGLPVFSPRFSDQNPVARNKGLEGGSGLVMQPSPSVKLEKTQWTGFDSKTTSYLPTKMWKKLILAISSCYFILTLSPFWRRVQPLRQSSERFVQKCSSNQDHIT
ncbi:hypothetical protein AMECASPLE_039824 [Ameca splendens]|uniref:Uncharacterized protein n=1 Tax=Ameca splendens TaxID=208324 RepID=A0ABV0Y959_9TELE